MTTDNTELPWIGLMGEAGSGKDTVADILVANLGYTRIAFADQVRFALLMLNPIVAASDRAGRPPVRVSDVVRSMGWDDAKRHVSEVRHLLQRLGTDAVRSMDRDFWVRTAERLAFDAPGPVVFTDLRFPNEARMVRLNGGLVWRISRAARQEMPGDTSLHVSEKAWLDIQPNSTITNNTSLHDLRQKVLRTVYQDVY